MPWDQGHFREGAPHSTSKTAKDKSNSSTLQASQGGKSDLSKHLLRCHSEKGSEKDSEKDSGYSEASSDDQRSSRSKPVRENSRKSGNAAGGASRRPYGEPPPVYVIKNLLVKPSAPEQLLHGPLAWRGGWHGLATAKPPTQLLLIQQPAVSAPPSSTPAPPSCLPTPQGPPKQGGGCNKQSHGGGNSYLPILNSYPRIAPHPRKDTHEAKGAAWAQGAKEGGGEGQSQSKRVCIEEEKWDLVSTTSDLQRSPKQQSRAKDPVQRSVIRGSSGRDGVGSPSVSSSQTPSPPSLSGSPSSSSPPSSSLSSSTANSPRHAAADSSSMRQRRFLNTAEILNQSGLLAITLRTKELLKQNAATDLELAQLRQHTQLLCQAAWGSQGAQGGQSWCNKSSDSLDKLLRAMNESGCYPSLDVEGLKMLSRTRTHEDQKNQKDQDDQRDQDRHGRGTTVHSGCPSVVSLQKLDDGTSPPSPLFAPSPDPH